jgi:hypothetical protein
LRRSKALSESGADVGTYMQVLAFEAFHMLTHGVNFYGDGDLFEGGGLLEGLEIIRSPLSKQPQEMPPRPSKCELDAVWELLCECMRAVPGERPSFAQVANRLSLARLAAPGAKQADWLHS